jgi:hypothetical protein
VSRVRIPQRVRVYLGCEGQSEQSYARLLGIVADSLGCHLYIDNDLLQPGGGDPLALVQLAVRRIQRKENQRGGTFRHRALLLDRDKFGQDPRRDAQVEAFARKDDLSLIWQVPCHEAFLLRHFGGFEAIRPATTDLAFEALRRIWPDYEKGMSAAQLGRRINYEGIRRVCAIEAGFANFLRQIGLPIE